MNSDIREKSIEVLKHVICKEHNVSIIERNIMENSDMIDDIYKRNIYQAAYDINNNVKLNDLLQNIKNRKIGWKHPYLNDNIFEEQEQDNFIIQPFEVHEGVITCSCGSKRVYSYQKQSRSADEPMSTYSNCMSCGNKWQYSG